MLFELHCDHVCSSWASHAALCRGGVGWLHTVHMEKERGQDPHSPMGCAHGTHPRELSKSPAERPGQSHWGREKPYFREQGPNFWLNRNSLLLCLQARPSPDTGWPPGTSPAVPCAPKQAPSLPEAQILQTPPPPAGGWWGP